MSTSHDLVAFRCQRKRETAKLQSAPHLEPNLETAIGPSESAVLPLVGTFGRSSHAEGGRWRSVEAMNKGSSVAAVTRLQPKDGG